ncbi:hypothetical protein QNI19_14625 [Cytophagaceae bacterium DM2B3-1]|uniref:Uncharacterized protein n=1 Tax=Xanthocytophaga flava TaxID=3048013 RepID=A0ABT7CKA3_9BACT|nr:hypothetical protein [Xanthocytophaga flavus]MDJ1494175.1 hypothetical protein [Xanthocytophaga flavus]
MSYFVKNIGCLTPKNNLQRAVAEALKDTDCLLVDSLDDFLNDINIDINEQIKQYPKCSPESVKVSLPQKPKPQTSIRVDVGGGYLSYVLYYIKGEIVKQ